MEKDHSLLDFLSGAELSKNIPFPTVDEFRHHPAWHNFLKKHPSLSKAECGELLGRASSDIEDAFHNGNEDGEWMVNISKEEAEAQMLKLIHALQKKFPNLKPDLLYHSSKLEDLVSQLNEVILSNGDYILNIENDDGTVSLYITEVDHIRVRIAGDVGKHHIETFRVTLPHGVNRPLLEQKDGYLQINVPASYWGLTALEEERKEIQAAFIQSFLEAQFPLAVVTETTKKRAAELIDIAVEGYTNEISGKMSVQKNAARKVINQLYLDQNESNMLWHLSGIGDEQLGKQVYQIAYSQLEALELKLNPTAVVDEIQTIVADMEKKFPDDGAAKFRRELVFWMATALGTGMMVYKYWG